MTAIQIYQFSELDEFGKYECYCSECGNVIYSDQYPTERECCPYCKARFAPNRTMSLDEWMERRR